MVAEQSPRPRRPSPIGELASALIGSTLTTEVQLRLAVVASVNSTDKLYNIRVGADTTIHEGVPALSTYSAGVAGDTVYVLESGNSRLILGTRWA